MSADRQLHTLLRQVEKLARDASLAQSFQHQTGALLSFIPVTPRALPAVDHMLMANLPTSPKTAALTETILAAAHKLHWMQSYSEAQVGRHFLDRYAYFNLISPEGPFQSDDIRVSVGYWGKGLTYPEHRHAPEEIYCVLAGGAVFRSGADVPVSAKPGDLIHHPPNLPHSMDMTDSGLLALAFWQGEHLLQPSLLGAEA